MFKVQYSKMAYCTFSSSYDVSVLQSEDPSAAITEVREESVEDANKFPVTNLYELQSRVFTDQWSIPYKKEESLGKCLIAAIKMAQNGKHKTLDNVQNIYDQWVPLHS